LTRSKPSCSATRAARRASIRLPRHASRRGGT
jgi:hypothetical protein